MTTSTGCRVVARSVETRTLAGVPRRIWVEELARGFVAMAFLLALVALGLVWWSSL